jgi:Fic family protein
MSFDRNKPFNSLPELPTKKNIETKKILKSTIAASRALAGAVNLCQQLPDDSIFYNSIFLKEAKESSEIENIVTTNDELYQSLSASQIIINQNTKEVFHYTDALWNGLVKMKNTGVLTTNVFIEIVNTIKENTAGIRVNPGIKIKNKKTDKTIYSPPEGKEIILNKLKNLEEYINTDDDIDPLIKMSVIHYQFEAIHPFADGNGRTGRIINILFLKLKGLLNHPMLFLSKYILDNKDDYYTKLRDVTENEKWEEWILYMLKGIEETSLYTTKKIENILLLMDITKEKIKKEVPKIYSKDLLEVLFERPYCKIKFLENAGIAKRATASKYLKKLETIGILKSIVAGKEKLYINTGFYKLLRD